MIITKLNGGLGNQLFQYALGKNLSESNNTILKLDTSWYKSGLNNRKYGLKNFNIVENFATPEEIKKFKRFSRIPFFSKYKKEKSRDFDPSILSLKNNIYLEGFWQSEKYFKDIREIILKEFTLKNTSSEEFNLLNGKIKNSRENSVAIHIRHGDYSLNPKKRKRHTALPIEYYRKAIEIINKKISNPYFFVFSDDTEWCKKQFNNLNNTHFVIDKDLIDYETIIAISRCKYQIIANSSFSWWGAWLNQNPNKIVTAPKKWYGNPNTKYNIDDRIPKEWIKIDFNKWS